MEATVAKIKKNASAELWICLREFQGRQYVEGAIYRVVRG